MLRHLVFGEGESPKKLAILIPENDFKQKALLEHYIIPLEKLGIPRDSIIAFNLDYAANGKAPVSTVAKPCLNQLEPILDQLGIKTILCCDAAYFKPLCRVTKTEPHYGYPTKTIWKGVNAFIAPNYRQIFYKPESAQKIEFSLEALTKHLHGLPGMFSQKVLEDANYPSKPRDIQNELKRLKDIKVLTCDIETYGLQVGKCGLATIAFAETQNKGISFWVNDDSMIREILKTFLQEYTGKLVFHNATFDTKVLIWELFMEHPTDYVGMLHGLDTLYRDCEDTKILAYLSLNSTAGNSLKLKELAFEFTGNYALDEIENIANIPPAEVLKYNLTDACATWYLYNKYRPKVIAELRDVYKDLFLPALKVITQMELVGMPMNLGQVLNVEHQLDDIAKAHTQAIKDHPMVAELTWLLRDKEAEKANLKLKKLKKTRNDFLDFEFNPNSPNQLIVLLYELMGLGIINTTDTGNPSTDSKTLKSHIEHLKRRQPPDQSAIDLVTHIDELSAVNKILTTFIPAFKENTLLKEGWSYLHGNFNLGGTKSGRLSSNAPNLMNIPSTGTEYAKAIKTCFQAPPTSVPYPLGWLQVGADFLSLEDRISALLTKDPNKISVYVDKFDGHCLRAFSYFSDRMPDIQQELLKAKSAKARVRIINSIEQRYPDLRQLSKGPTFALTYMGTSKTLIKNFGLTPEEALQIEKNYHKLYHVADEWVKAQLRVAQKKSYVELAFGLRLHTPILPQIILDSYASLPYEAYKEMKTAANALGQSYGLLNTKAANLFMERVWKSPYRHVVLPTAHIHDAQYYLIQNSLGCLKWVNDNLVECMQWNKLPPIQHPKVKLEAKLEVFYPDWSTGVKLPNKASIRQIQKSLERFNIKTQQDT